ncbi:kinase-like protein [Gonapodya prolifera JEL478]|uniref:Kinase-like protein n=1 Tax=Gonapodya prolifera (strain JEL478) TaxID=1344416 RepID=A0A139AHH4_GONPJ|nr:kinase-like protein [Gonapodya prolifera JEL478]|eukprot:KXS16139.1 kinase-like protein [Gonapodya prolifera JEL478]
MLRKLVLGKADPPSKIKKKDYDVVRVLGAGASGQVTECIHRPTGRRFAVKSMPKDGLPKLTKADVSDPSMEGGFREIYTLKQVSGHPNIIEMVDWFEGRNTLYLVTELATGGEVFDHIANMGRYTEADAAVIAATLCNAVAFMHDHGVVHRDLKTQNIMFRDRSDDTSLVIVDFGIANVLKDKKALLNTRGVGTPSYLSPELLTEKPYGPPTDCWALGIITHHLLVGYGPFEGGYDYPDILAKILKSYVQFDAPEWAPVSAAAKSFIKRFLAINPQSRMTAKEALDHEWIRKMVPADYIESLRLTNYKLEVAHGIIEKDPVWEEIIRLMELRKAATTMSGAATSKDTPDSADVMGSSPSSADSAVSVADVTPVYPQPPTAPEITVAAPIPIPTMAAAPVPPLSSPIFIPLRATPPQDAELLSTSRPSIFLVASGQSSRLPNLLADGRTDVDGVSMFRSGSDEPPVSPTAATPSQRFRSTTSSSMSSSFSPSSPRLLKRRKSSLSQLSRGFSGVIIDKVKSGLSKSPGDAAPWS